MKGMTKLSGFAKCSKSRDKTLRKLSFRKIFWCIPIYYRFKCYIDFQKPLSTFQKEEKDRIDNIVLWGGHRRHEGDMPDQLISSPLTSSRTNTKEIIE